MRTGVWLVGARGSVATTSIVGALALRAGLTRPTGCVTELPAVGGPALPTFSDLVFGGHDVVATPLAKRAETLAAAGVLPARLVAALPEELAAVDQELRPAPTDGSQADRAAAIVRDLTGFRDRHGLARVVVVNVSATEAAPEPHPAHADPAALSAALTGPDEVLPPSSLYAYAAVTAGCPYVDFTPSTGLRLPALSALAEQHRVPYAGHDGKTGETLLKSVLAPMFAMRNLHVRSWSGTNLLGGGDGATLADPAANAAKVRSKQRVLGETLGYLPQGDTRIDYVEELGDFKTAWDLITFAGFLGTGMRLEFTWHGCDSALAAPLVLDLARLAAAAHAAGRSGPLTELAFFFKDPLGEGTHSLADQWTRLCEFAHRLHTGGTDDPRG
ncbi:MULTISPECIES: inositol-3-phosphate synthase [Micromonospora]|uniref:Myo-inositol-1-phosphate synthase n=1 Tax=Micromonospora maris TaxID=1003110 RepID=A0A9X0I337_9ACTN|nr:MULTISPECIES: inositol-3-phosphate synthase [Micromonospora]AEB46691.1 myo-inositol-1-phosphate synthase [Micromonospora maris AB-18-032]KUJ45885.1 myo-inositol-1-phosphate synthase [Micromonospora maris]RUL90777.1 myo-inositol-1-phosphate synthase [Verrucosispora sp. FIM060022]